MSYAGGSGNVAYATRSSPTRKAASHEEHPSLTESPLPYRHEDMAEPGTRYCDTDTNGIVPGYAGHRPRAQHNYGKSSFGDPSGKSHSAELRKKGELILFGDMATWSDNGARCTGDGIDGEQAGHPNTKADGGVWSDGKPDYREEVGGVLPGYGGHVPRALHKNGASAVGKTPPFDTLNEHEEIAELRKMFSRQPIVRGLENGDYKRADPNDDGEEWWPTAPPSAAIEGHMIDFRDERNGVLPGYAGHVPRGKDKYGASAVGHTRTVVGEEKTHLRDQSNSGVRVQGVIMSQMNRQNSKAEVPFKAPKRHDGNGVVPGYRGHVPGVKYTVGMSTYLSGPGFTEMKVEAMDKAGGAGDLGDAAAAYGMNDAGASSFSDDGANNFSDLGGSITSSQAKDSASAGGFVDQYTFADAAADAAEVEKQKNIERRRLHDQAKRDYLGY